MTTQDLHYSERPPVKRARFVQHDSGEVELRLPPDHVLVVTGGLAERTFFRTGSSSDLSYVWGRDYGSRCEWQVCDGLTRRGYTLQAAPGELAGDLRAEYRRAVQRARYHVPGGRRA